MSQGAFYSNSEKVIFEEKKTYELCHHFQESWIVKLPWAKVVKGEDGALVSQAKRIVCSKA